MPIPMAQVLRLYIKMFLSYGLYVCTVLETAHHRTTFRIFCNITQNTTPEDNSYKMFHISSPIVLFLMGRSRIFGEIMIKFHLGMAKGRDKRGYGKEAQNKVGLFFAKFPILSKIQTLYHKLLIKQTCNHHLCNWHAKKSRCGDFQVILSSSSWSKTTFFVYF